MAGGPLGAVFRALFRALGASTHRPRPSRPQPPADPPILDVIVHEPPAPPPPTVVYPLLDWPHSTAPAEGLAPAALAAIPDSLMGDAILIRHGYLVATWGDPYRRETNWASVCRSFSTTAWLMALTDGSVSRALLDTPLRTVLDTPTVRDLHPDTTLAHLLSGTSDYAPPGTRWRYSGSGWPQRDRLFGELLGVEDHAYLNQRLFSLLGGALTAVETSADDTLRIHGSCADLARWGYLWLRQGRWGTQTLMDPALMARALGGGPFGDGRPVATEGWQIHLVKGGRHTEGVLPGVPDDAFFAYGSVDRGVVAIVPSLDLVLARHRDHGVPIDRILPPVCAAVR